MSARDDILRRIRAHQPAPRALPEVPAFDTAGGSPLERFKAGVARMGGNVAERSDGEDLAALVGRIHPGAKAIASATPELAGNHGLDPANPAALGDVDVGVVRALFGVAETGSVWITDAQFGVSALGFLAQHLVVLFDPATIVDNMHHAYRQRAQFDAGYGVFMTGPSATADIEGVLIHGAQGVRSLTVVLDRG
jgi:L-lactate dehydrogenase complex protein LldG